MNASSLRHLVSDATPVCGAAAGGKVACHRRTRRSLQGNLAGVWAHVVGSGLKCLSSHLLYRRQACSHSFTCFGPNYPSAHKHARNCRNNDPSPTASASPRAQAGARHLPSPFCFKNGIFWPNFQRWLVILITALIYQRTNALQFPKNRLV